MRSLKPVITNRFNRPINFSQRVYIFFIIPVGQAYKPKSKGQLFKLNHQSKNQTTKIIYNLVGIFQIYLLKVINSIALIKVVFENFS